MGRRGHERVRGPQQRRGQARRAASRVGGTVSPYYADDKVTLYHGDCLEVREWLSADVLVSDVPYGMNFQSGWAGAFEGQRIRADENTDARDAALNAWGNRPALIFGRWSVPRPQGVRTLLTWDKGEHVGMGDLAIPWKPNTEEIYVLGGGFTGRRTGSVLRHLAIAGTVGQAARGTRHHPTQKPVGLMEELIDKCPPGVIADPFAGSGSTLIAARNLGRRAIGVEIEESYCEVIARRLDQGCLVLGDGAW